ncbi:MAG: hypothetical protein ACKVPX_16885 [Myxococcaceae bacterium]
MSEGAVPVTNDGKCEAAAGLLTEVSRLMEMPMRVEAKDAEDGNVAVALYPQAESLSLLNGKRSPLLDALQFLVNKMVNPPTGPRRWVTLGVGGFPAPKGPPPPRTEPRPNGAAAKPAPLTAPPPTRAVPSSGDETTLEVSPDAVLEKSVRALAEASAKRGRFYAVLTMKPEERARALRAVKDVSGVKVVAEGDSYLRRLMFRPDKPLPMPKRSTMPADDEE